MARKVILDCDPGIADAVALTMALFDPDVEVLAVTPTAGAAEGEQAGRNVQAIIERLDPPRFPRIGAAMEPELVTTSDGNDLNGQDGLGNLGLAVSELHHQHPSEKIISDLLHTEPEDVTVICLGPLTNLARAFRRDPNLPSLVGRVLMTGGAVDGVGDVSAAAEFNMHFDSVSAREVFLAPCTKTLVPLDITRNVIFDLGLLDKLPDEESRAGALLRPLLTFLFRAYRQSLGQEGILLAEAVTIVAATRPELFQMEEMVGDVETRGELTLGSTIFDRRSRHREQPNMEVAVRANTDEIIDAVVRSLRRAGERTS